RALGRRRRAVPALRPGLQRPPGRPRLPRLLRRAGEGAPGLRGGGAAGPRRRHPDRQRRGRARAAPVPGPLRRHRPVAEAGDHRAGPAAPRRGGGRARLRAAHGGAGGGPMNADDLLPRPLDDYLAAADAEQFPGLRPGAVRLDSPAGTLVHAAVRDGIADYLGGPMVSNDGEPFPASRHSDELAAWARGRVAALLGAPAGEVLFGPNMTTLTSMFVRAVEAG